MKTLALIILTLFFGPLLKAQNFYVVKVEGNVLVEKKGLKTGDKLNSESVIEFSDAKDKLYLLSPSDGYFLLSPAEKAKSQKDWVIAMKNAIIPKNKYYKTATRGTTNSVNTFDDIYDLMGFFRNKVLIIDEASFGFNPENIVLDEKNYFKFNNLSGKALPELKYDNKTFSINGEFKSEKFEMIYVQNEGRKEIGTFLLNSMTRKMIASELSVFFNTNETTNSTKIYFEQVLPYLAEAYGNTNMETIKKIIAEDLKIPLTVQD